MKSNFIDCLNRVLKDEGGYSNDPSDSGGATNFGITIADYCKYINKNGTPNDVRCMTVQQAGVIYKARYWDALGCDKMASGVDYTCFDYGVNSGLGRPRKALERFKSLQGTDLITAINNERTAFLQALATNRPKDQKFLAGWMARVKRVRNYSIYLNSHKPDNTTGPVIATGVGGTMAGLLHYFNQHSTIILLGAVIAALFIGTIVHIYRNRGTK